MNRREQYRIAQRRMKRKRGFYKHLGIMLAVCVPIILLSAFESSNPAEALPIAFIWAIPLSIHYVVAFGLPFVGLGGPEWQEKQLERELEKLEPLAYDDPDDEEPLDLTEPLRRKERSFRDFV